MNNNKSKRDNRGTGIICGICMKEITNEQFCGCGACLDCIEKLYNRVKILNERT